MTYKQIVDAWTEQNKGSEWSKLGYDEKMVWFFHCGKTLFNSMESAPKDGTLVILKWKHDLSWSVAKWDGDEWGWQPMNYEEWGPKQYDSLFIGWKEWEAE